MRANRDSNHHAHKIHTHTHTHTHKHTHNESGSNLSPTLLNIIAIATAIHLTCMPPGSEQYAFLCRDLARVNRSNTPHVVFTGHRPMYGSTSVGEFSYGGRYVRANASFNWAMAEALEPLFQKYNVSLALWGHVHNYERTCPLLNQTCRSDGTGSTDQCCTQAHAIHPTQPNPTQPRHRNLATQAFQKSKQKQKPNPNPIGTTHITAGTAGAGATLFPTFNASSGGWTVRTCASNGTDQFVGIDGVSATCQKCADVSSCTVGHLPCRFGRCAPPATWSLARAEHHGYVRIAATMDTMHVEYVAVNLSQPIGTAGAVVDSVLIHSR